ncbi:hypothetical protein [Clostridium sp.]|uniref:hypothetical protein n=1 Tax=Clostridium sp. TaxID=1506 RepID=UPI001DC304FD|nr:hypothetical protein [Clostridium sp.]MBS5939137.1 hypothetical protein [Clostridium sp.]
MSSEIKIKSDIFYETITILKQVNINLNYSIKKIKVEGNRLSNTWDSKSGNDFSVKNKKIISNMELLSDGMEDLVVALNKINLEYEETDRLASSKMGS